ncbi:polysaccharide biosynthesis protein [Nocardia aurantiaca]|uniref:Polysaccharide biosynthesis protein n=2 Tax=Nocardia aurantiaca TaxID=2675850 RepID=A0A6I3KZ27_9NOCA|nr:polysaccharide biosynthesis protein [Nocardia aurantiaca]MTE14761.1 polysaccharide biosynthesis protein [Nocardia aurantiaca]
MTANVAGYLLQLLASRWLGVAGYSSFASLLAVQMLCAVPALALQNVVAREVVRAASVAAARALALRCAGLVAGLSLALVPVIAAGLKVEVAAAAGALCSAPVLVLLAGEQGILQGGSRFRELAVVLGGAAIVRVAPALIVLAVGGGPAAALWAGAAGVTCATLAARHLADEEADQARRPSPSASETGAQPMSSVSAGIGGVSAMSAPERAVDRTLGVLPVFRATQVQAALMALSSADLLISRIVLDENDAGRYALGAIAAKIAFWLPQAVGVVLYPRMAQPQHSARAMRSALAVLVGIGAVTVAGAAVAAPLAPLFAGKDYAPIEGSLWLFALQGALLAVLQAALLSAIATDRTAPAAITWIGLGAGIAVMLTCAHSMLSLIITATVTAAVTTLVITGVALRAANDGAESPTRVPDLGASGT